MNAKIIIMSKIQKFRSQETVRPSNASLTPVFQTHLTSNDMVSFASGQHLNGAVQLFG